MINAFLQLHMDVCQPIRGCCLNFQFNSVKTASETAISICGVLKVYGLGLQETKLTKFESVVNTYFKTCKSYKVMGSKNLKTYGPI